MKDFWRYLKRVPLALIIGILFLLQWESARAQTTYTILPPRGTTTIYLDTAHYGTNAFNTSGSTPSRINSRSAFISPFDIFPHPNTNSNSNYEPFPSLGTPLSQVDIFTTDVVIKDLQGRTDKITLSKADLLWKGFYKQGIKAYGDDFWLTVFGDIGLASLTAGLTYGIMAVQGTPAAPIINAIVIGLAAYWIISTGIKYWKLIANGSYEQIGANIFEDLKALLITIVSGGVMARLAVKIPKLKSFMKSMRSAINKSYSAKSEAEILTFYRCTNEAEALKILDGEEITVLVSRYEKSAIQFGRVHHKPTTDGRLYVLKFEVPRQKIDYATPSHPNTPWQPPGGFIDLRTGHPQLHTPSQYMIEHYTMPVK